MMSFPILLTVTLIQRLSSVVKMEQLMYLICTVGDALELSGKLGEIFITRHLALTCSLGLLSHFRTNFVNFIWQDASWASDMLMCE